MLHKSLSLTRLIWGVLLFQTRDRRPAGRELFAGAAAVQLPEKLGVRAGAGGRAGRGRAGRPPLAGRALALHRHGVRVSETGDCVQHASWPPSMPDLHSSIFSTDSDVFERFIYFSRRFMARCASSAPLPAGRLHSRRSDLSIADYYTRLLFYLSVHKIYLDIIILCIFLKLETRIHILQQSIYE